eukprot:TRINITY_DN7856_c0_g1_i1.p1 TRINITY_DN7856_c0_g1~~TRINITY_DN7856_c0_g1_i1.p1  ORF type:complete len:575 (-),score=91.97 TRINITY_DN7856_c0_g1_i1:13-1737(-)
MKIDQLQTMLPGMPCFEAKNYSELEKQLKNLGKTTVSDERTPFKLRFEPANATLQRSKENLRIKISFAPEQPLLAIPKGTRLKFLRSNYFYEREIELQEEATEKNPFTTVITLEITPNGELTGEFPSHITCEIIIPEHDDIPETKYRMLINMLLAWLGGDFIGPDDRTMNVMVYGPMGSGKSSLINGFITALSMSQAVKKPLSACRFNTHVTQIYEGNTVSELLEQCDDSNSIGIKAMSSIKMRLFDTWGLTSTTYQKLQLIHFLEGRVPNGTVMNDDIVGRAPADADMMIHAVIFVIPIATSQAPPLLDTLAKNIEICVQFGITPIIVVNFINTCSSEEERRAVDIIWKKTSLARSDIYELDNYEHEVLRNMAKDLKYFKILQKLMVHIRKSMKRLRVPTSDFAPVSYEPGDDTVVCPNSSCEKHGQPTDGKKCLYCGSVAVHPVNQVEGGDEALAVHPVACARGRGGATLPRCGSVTCRNFQQRVTSKFCPECGKPPKSSNAANTCGNSECVSFNKAVTSKFCPDCGKKVASNLVEDHLYCQNAKCAKENEIVTSKFCPECGSTPSAAKDPK